MNQTQSLAQLVAVAATAKHVPVPRSQALTLPPGSRVWPAQVISRWAEGCHIRIAEQHDTVLPADAVPENAENFGLRVVYDGVVVIPAA